MNPVTTAGQATRESALLISGAVALPSTRTQEVSEAVMRAAALQASVIGLDKPAAKAIATELAARRDAALAQAKSTFEASDKSDAAQRVLKQESATVRKLFDGEGRAIEQLRSQTAFTEVPAEQRATPDFREMPEGTPRRVLVPYRFGEEVDDPYFNAGTPPRVYDPFLATTLAFQPTGEVRPEDKAIVIFLHGAGAMYSNSNALLGLINDVTKLETNGQKKRAFASVAVDLPYHGFGARDDSLRDVDAYMAYLHLIVQRYAAYGKPIFLFGRSFGANSAIEYACRYDDITGVIAMSGFHKDWEAENIANMHANGFAINQDGLDFAMGIANHLSYFDPGARPLVGGLILYGEKDVEYDPVKQRALWPVLGAALGYAVRGFENGEHNLFDPKNPEVLREARALVQGFILEQIAASNG